MKKIVAMYEQEEAYGRNLAEYVNRRENIPFEVQVFSEPDKFSDYLQGHTPHLLLLSEESGLDVYGSVRDKTKQILYLTGHKELEQENHIYKYQPTDQILNQLMQCISEKEQKDSPILQTSSLVYGVYSPIGRCGKTTFSFLLGEMLSRKRSVLYMGFDELSFLDEGGLGQSENAGSLSDAYFYCQKNSLKEKLPSLVSHWHGVDILTGMNCPEDLPGIQTDEWAKLVREIVLKAGYGAVVLDLGTKLWLADALFYLCAHIYVPVLSDRHAKEQQRRFEEWMGKSCEEAVRQRIQMIELPACPQNGSAKERLEYALWGETGDYVRGLMKSEW